MVKRISEWRVATADFLQQALGEVEDDSSEFPFVTQSSNRAILLQWLTNAFFCVFIRRRQWFSLHGLGLGHDRCK